MPANSLNSLGIELTRLIGAPLGGALMALMGLASVVVLDCVSFVVSALLIGLIATPRGAQAAPAAAPQAPDAKSVPGPVRVALFTQIAVGDAP